MKPLRCLSAALAAASASLIQFSSDVNASSSAPSLGCVTQYLGDGYCDPYNNYENCGYDGGDCCQCTCASSPEFDCGVNGFECLDSSASCVDDDNSISSSTTYQYSGSTSEPYTTSTDCVLANVGDGDCDTTNNQETCGYDGGDCCQCTCVSTPDYACGFSGFQCVDPSASCAGDDDITVVPTTSTGTPTSSSTTSQGCIPAYIGDGDCDEINNDEECGYDGGDCCLCTCVSTELFTCRESADFDCIDPSASCVDDNDVTTSPFQECIAPFFGDGDCDRINNNEDCGYDGGDCCQCTCMSTRDIPCGINAFDCIDPSAPCVGDDDDFTLFPSDTMMGSYMFSECVEDFIGDGYCDEDNNNDDCEYDGGDCCECTCGSTDFYTCGVNGFMCADPSSPCSDGSLVEAGTVTTIETLASAFDERPGAESNDIGCGEEGCAPLLARDGVATNPESRWSCAKKIVPEGGPCEIHFAFENPQNIRALEVAFWKADERDRTIKVTVNGDVIGKFRSDSDSTFTSSRIKIDEVKTVTLESIGIDEDEWISILEVRFMVQP